MEKDLAIGIPFADADHQVLVRRSGSFCEIGWVDHIMGHDFAYREPCVGHEQGAAAGEAIKLANGGGVEHFLDKPISARSLLKAVLDALSGAV